MLSVALSAFALVALACAWAAGQSGPEDGLIGWGGESYRPEAVWDKITGEFSGSRAPSFRQQTVHHPEGSQLDESMRVLSWDPRVFYYPQFLAETECKHLIKTAIPKLKKSVVYDANGKLVVDSIRTSYGTFLRRRHDPVVRNISERGARITHTPAVNQEDLQVLRYGNQQYYNAHFDTSKDRFESHRYITLVMYLADVAEGGETTFPNTLAVNSTWEEENGPFSTCAQGHVSVKPRRGDAVMFFSVTPDGLVDEKTKHAGCPVLRGTKWTSTIWVHTKPWRAEDFYDESAEDVEVDPGICKDFHEKCGEWASGKECERNPVYMVGQGDKIGACRKSCAVCGVCGPGDRECYRKNREQAGYLDLDADAEISKAFPAA